MSADDVRDHLGAFGLSTKEIDAYLAVLRAGAATTGEVSRAADVSQGYVYELAEALTDRGLVDVPAGRLLEVPYGAAPDSP